MELADTEKEREMGSTILSSVNCFMERGRGRRGQRITMEETTGREIIQSKKGEVGGRNTGEEVKMRAVFCLAF